MTKRLFLLILLSVIFFTGCFFSNNNSNKHYYQIYYKPKVSNRSPVDKIVRIKPFQIDKIYKRYNVVYRTSLFELFYYKTHLWAVKPDYMITDITYKHIKSSNLFKDVISKLNKKPDYVITGRISALDELDSGDKWYARVGIEFICRDFSTGDIIATHKFEKRKPVSNKQPVYVVRAMGEIIEQEIETFLNKVNNEVSTIN